MDELESEIRRVAVAIRAEAARIANSEAALDAIKRIEPVPSPYRSFDSHRRRPIIAAAALVVAAVGLILYATRDRHEGIVVNNGTTAVPASPSVAPPLSSSALSSLAQVGAPWFISPAEGWVLAVHKNSGSMATDLLHTIDGGMHWSLVGPSPVHGKCLDLPRPLRFADERSGWILGCNMFSTHDGGSTWNMVPMDVWEVDVSHGQVHAVAGGDQQHIFVSPIDHDDFVKSSDAIPPPPGAPRDTHLALGASAGVMVVTDRIQFEGARLERAQWVSWTPPCEEAGGFTLPAASPSSDEIVYACTTPGLYNATSADSSVVRVYVSHDGAKTFRETPQPLPAPAGSTAASIALPAEGKIVVSWHNGDSSVLVASDDDGASWHQLATSSDDKEPSNPYGVPGDFVNLEFTTVNDGVSNLDHSVAVTHDGGRHWTAVFG